jgi:serine/threonine protein kinase/tetratricopeptide (TPR) repeat protein
MTCGDTKAKSIFLAALERYPADQWAAYLDGACGDDQVLRGRVEDLLKAHRELGSVHIRPAPDRVATTDQLLREGPGTVIGPYKLLEQIGEGGMGVVYMTEQQKPVRRKVALKIIKPGMDTRQVIARFEAERQALALMDHPNIARVLDAGATESGRPYFVMELVKGIPITDYCDRNRLAIADRLELFVLVCQAVQHAHQKGIIHRDLKPSNVLVTMIDGAAVPKVIDFGVAKAMGQQLTEKTLFTGFAQLIGTPLYMSPEQAEFSGVDVDTRSDIYALGVLLYELLTGTTPFDQDTFRTAAYDEIRRIIREVEPPKPSTRISTLEATAPTVSANRQSDPHALGKLMRGELDWIVMKALEKDRNRRYETANGLAADVRRYLDDEPVQACPPSAWYRFRKFASRNRKGLATTALLTGSGVIVAFALGAVYLQNISRVRQVTQDVQLALAGARTAIEAGDLTLAGQRVASAQGHLGPERERLADVAGEIDCIRHEIEARQADAARFSQFLKGASDVQDKMSLSWGTSGFLTSERDAEEVLGLYGILTEKDWLSRLEKSYLTADQKQQVRETAYVTLVLLADYEYRIENTKELRRTARSLDLLRRALAFHRPTRAFYFVRAQSRRRLGDTAADEDYQRVQATEAETAEDYMLAGGVAAWLGNYDEAIRCYQAGLALQPNKYRSLAGLGDTYCRLDRHTEALAYFTAYLASLPADVPIHMARAKCYLELGNRDAAQADFEAALALARTDGERVNTYIQRVVVYSGLGLWDAAKADYEAALALTRTDGERALVSNGIAWQLATHPLPRLRNPVRAVALAREAVEKAPQEGTIWNTLGVALHRTGDWEAAIVALEKAEALEPDKYLAHNGFFLAMAHRQRGESDPALRWYHKAVAWMDKNGPEDDLLWRFRAEAAGLLGLADLPDDVFARP